MSLISHGQNGTVPATRFLRRLALDARASTLPIMAAALIPVMAMIGGGIDFGRAYLAQSKLQGAVDSAALAAIRAKQKPNTTNAAATRVAAEYILANFPEGYLGSTLAEEKIEVFDQNEVVSTKISASGTVRTTLLRVVGLTSLPFSVEAEARVSERLPNAVEALLILDNTGSMQAGTRLADSKKASKSFVSALYLGEETREDIAIGFLPYNTVVNVGRLVEKHDPSMVKSYPGFTDVPGDQPMGWKGCVFSLPTEQNISSDPQTVEWGAYDITDNMPGESGIPPLEPFVFPPVEIRAWSTVNNRYKVDPSQPAVFGMPVVKDALVARHGNDICMDPDTNADVTCDQSGSVVSIDRLPDASSFRTPKPYSHKSGFGRRASPFNLWGPSPNFSCPAEALPIAYDQTRAELDQYVDNEFGALQPGMGTFHNIAMTWGYRLISRDDVFPRNTPSDKPVKKVVIFMTDGNFAVRDRGRNTSDGKKNDTVYWAHGTLEDRTIVSNKNTNNFLNHSEYRFLKTCEAMKEDGIEIFTIAFAINNGGRRARTIAAFQSCATNPTTHFFSAADGAELENAFLTIATEITTLRLVK
ncbi:MAG: TadE/TadG family type IV pilus assembly protein [Pseudomonadota bacterium]